MNYGSLCSGIEAASEAWIPLGWRARFFAEIEPFPCAVLKQRHPGVPNYGDMTRFKEWDDTAIDVLVGGTPCQSFSVAGLRKGLADPRGNLMLTYLAIADRYRPDWLVWENVPGVLSDQGNAFGAFLGGLAELGYGFAYRVLDAQYFGVPQRRRRVFVVGCLGDWRRAAAVLFERASLRGDPAPSRKAGERVAPTVEARANAGGAGWGTDFLAGGGMAAEVVARPVLAGGHANNPIDENLVSVAFKASHFTRGKDGAPSDVAPPLSADADKGDQDTLVCAIQERAVCENPDAGPDGAGFRDDGQAYTLEARTVPQAVAFDVMTLAIRGRGDSHDLEYREDGTANAILTPNGGRAGIGVGAVAFALRNDAGRSGEAKNASRDAEGNMRKRDAGFNVSEELAPTLDATAPHTVAYVTSAAVAFDTYNQTTSEDVTQTLCSRGESPGGNAHLVPAIAFSAKDHGGDAMENCSPTLRAVGHANSHANAGVMPAVAFNGDPYASAHEADSSSVLSTLRDRVGKKAVAEWGSRILDSLQSPKVLRSWLYGEGLRRAADGFRSFVDDCPLPREEGEAARTMRIVWENGPDGRTPQGRGLAKQLSHELGKALPELPPSLAPQSSLMQVRRLTPRECERLMGFPDDYTLITVRGKPAADGPRYKALGNSMAVPVMRWIGERIAAVEAIPPSRRHDRHAVTEVI